MSGCLKASNQTYVFRRRCVAYVLGWDPQNQSHRRYEFSLTSQSWEGGGAGLWGHNMATRNWYRSGFGDLSLPFAFILLSTLVYTCMLQILALQFFIWERLSKKRQTIFNQLACNPSKGMYKFEDRSMLAHLMRYPHINEDLTSLVAMSHFKIHAHWQVKQKIKKIKKHHKCKLI